MSIRFWVGSFTVVLAASLVACTGDVNGTGGSGGGGTTSATTTSTGTGGQGAPCGGLPGLTCPSDQYCVWADGSCGGGDQEGVCTGKPMSCAVFEAVPWEVCGCDGKVYEDSCNAAQSGVDISNHGGCQLQQGQVACGPLVCVNGNQYCEHNLSDVSGQPDSYTCRFFPATCPMPATCACLSGEPCGTNCTQAADGTITVMCPGG
jgi:hypothetical protein